MLGLLAADGINVLVDRVGGAHVPGGAGALHGRQNLEELAQLLRHNAGPAFTNVAVQRERLVLGEDVDLAQAGVDAVGECDVDDAVVAAKGYRRFGAIAGERKEPFARATRQQYSECVSHVRMPHFRVTLPFDSAWLVLPAINPCRYPKHHFPGDIFLRTAPNGGEYHRQMNTRSLSGLFHTVSRE